MSQEQQRRYPASKVVSIVLVAVLLGISLFATVRDREYLTPEELATADAATGYVKSFARLPHGTTHYELAGPTNGPLVVLIHGVSGPMTVWDRTVPPLIAAGFRTLRLDLYGRGYSDRPDADYDLPAYVRQVEELLESLQLHGELRLVGSSMGTLVAAEYLKRHAETVRAVAFIGPAGFKLANSPLAGTMTWPVLGEFLMKSFGDEALSAHDREYFVDPSATADFQAHFDRQLLVRGSKRAILHTMRQVPLQDYLAGFAGVSTLHTPALVIWGRQDAAFPFVHHTELEGVLPGVPLVPIDGAGHLPQYERADATNAALIPFLNAHR